MGNISCYLQDNRTIILLVAIGSLCLFAIINTIIMIIVCIIGCISCLRNKKIKIPSAGIENKLHCSESTKSDVPLAEFFAHSEREPPKKTVHDYNDTVRELDKNIYAESDDINPFLPTGDTSTYLGESNVYDTLVNENFSNSIVPLMNTYDVSSEVKTGTPPVKDAEVKKPTTTVIPKLKKLNTLGIDIPMDLQVESNIYTMPMNTYDTLEPQKGPN